MAPAANSIEAVLENKDAAVLDAHASINLRDARIKFSKIVNAARVRSEKVIITNHGEPAAAVIPIKKLKIIDLFDAAGFSPELCGEIEDLEYNVISKEKAIEIIRKLGEEVGEASDGRAKESGKNGTER